MSTLSNKSTDLHISRDQIMRHLKAGRIPRNHISIAPMLKPKRPLIKSVRNPSNLSDKEALQLEFQLAYCSIGVRILESATRSMRNMGVIHNRDAIFDLITAFKGLESKFANNAEFEALSMSTEDHFYRYISATEEERNRVDKFLESIQNKRK